MKGSDGSYLKNILIHYMYDYTSSRAASPINSIERIISYHIDCIVNKYNSSCEKKLKKFQFKKMGVVKSRRTFLSFDIF